MVKTKIEFLKCKWCKKLQPHRRARSGKIKYKYCMKCDLVRDKEITIERECTIKTKMTPHDEYLLLSPKGEGNGDKK